MLLKWPKKPLVDYNNKESLMWFSTMLVLCMVMMTMPRRPQKKSGILYNQLIRQWISTLKVYGGGADMVFLLWDVQGVVPSSTQLLLWRSWEQQLHSWHVFRAHIDTASKGAVLALTRELATVHARENIRFNALCPGPIRTPLLMNFLNTEEKKNRRMVHVPMGRFGIF